MPDVKRKRQPRTTTITIHEDGSCEVLIGKVPYKFESLVSQPDFPNLVPRGEIKWFDRPASARGRSKQPFQICVKGDVRTVPEGEDQKKWFDGVCRYIQGVLV